MLPLAKTVEKGQGSKQRPASNRLSNLKDLS